MLAISNFRGSPFPVGTVPVEGGCLAALGCWQTEIRGGMCQPVFHEKAHRTGGHDIPCKREQANLPGQRLHFQLIMKWTSFRLKCCKPYFWQGLGLDVAQ
ncbi:hypothetical protein AD948_02630 [Acetobacter senegalensis]|uniref:Uncharacterized protein n=1 Tax=Acetobacter senegalensis TaxID=446692 RepID=A0A149U7B5_9PROT|nr:hypothetical protein AD948_02630 [Acetobacter senegalensis]